MLRKKANHRAEALGNVPLFRSCNDEELAEIAGLVTESETHADQVLCAKGTAGHEFFVLVEGTAKVNRGEGPPVTIEAGSFFGELALLDDGPRTATVTMQTDGRVLVLSGTEFRQAIRASPHLALRLLSALAARLRDVDSSSS